MALQKNDDLRVEVFNPAIAEAAVEKEKGAFDPAFDSTLQQGTNTTRDTSAFGANQDTKARQLLKGTAGLKKKFELGTTATLSYEVEGNEPHPKSGDLNSVFTSSIVLRLEQDLLKSAGVDINTTRIRVAQKGVEGANLTFSNRVLETVANVQNQYWDYVQAIRKVEIQTRSHALAAGLLEKKREEVRLGALAPIQLVEIESDVASRKTDITNAIKARRLAEIRLRTSLGIRQDFEGGPSEILPKDSLMVREKRFSPAQILRMLLENRPDIRKAQVDIESKEFELKFAKNQILPTLQMFGSFGFSDADPNKSEVYYPFEKGDRRRWEAGLKLSFPLYNRVARGDFDNQRFLLRRLHAERDRIENTAKREAREALSNVRENAVLYRNALEALELRKKRLEAEEEKLKIGLSNIRDLLDAQTEVINAESTVVDAQTEYVKSLTALYKAMGVIDPEFDIELYKVKPEVPPLRTDR